MVKPNAEGSSVGVFLVREGANRPVAEVGAADWAYGDQVMVEPFIAGKELAVTVLGEATGPRALTITDITPPRASTTTGQIRRGRLDARPARRAAAARL